MSRSPGTVDTTALVTRAPTASDSGISNVQAPSGCWSSSITWPSRNLLDLLPSTVTASRRQTDSHSSFSGSRTQAETVNAWSVRRSIPAVVATSLLPSSSSALPARPGANLAPPESVAFREPTASAALEPLDSSSG